MPIEDLLALYGYGGEGEQHEVPLEEIRPEPLPSFPSAKTTDEQMKNVPGTEKEDDSRSVSSESSRLSAAQSSNSHEENGFDPFQNQRITRGSKLIELWLTIFWYHSFDIICSLKICVCLL